MNFLLFLLKIIFFPVVYIYRKLPFKLRRTIASKFLGFLTFFKVFFSLFGSVFSFEKGKKDEKKPPGIKLLYLTFFFTGLFAIWAYYAEFDQVITGEGKVFPFSRLQTIEHFEGGLLEKIHVSRGDSVRKNDLLVSLSPLQADSDYNIQSSNVALLGIKIARLEAEYANEDDFTVDEKIKNEYNDIFENEYFLFKRRRSLLKNELSQRVNNIKVSRVKVSSAKAIYVASGEELEITKLLVEKGLDSKLSLIKAKRIFAEAASARDIAMEELTIAKSDLVSFKIEAKTEVLNELSKVKAEFMAATQGIRVAADKADRTQIRAPIDGIVNRVLISTEGSAVKAGETVVELVPADQTIVVEANILPADIGFIRVGQKAQVKITAYDFSVFGALSGVVNVVAADTTTNDKGENFYVVKVDLDQDYVTAKEKSLKVIPGMTAQVDIITGKRSPLEYIFSPITKVLKESFTEK